MANKPQDQRVSDLAEKINRLKAGEPVIMGGESDVRYLTESIATLRIEDHSLSEELDGLVHLLGEVDPCLSVWEARKNRNPIEQQVTAYSRGDYLYKFQIEPAAASLIGLDTLNASNLLVSNYWNSGPFITALPHSLTPDQFKGLWRLGFEFTILEKNEALALFIDIGRVRRVQKLTKDGKYLDKKIIQFMEREAGNYGNMYFIGPPCDYEDEIKKKLSPTGVKVHSSYAGISTDRRVFNLVGKIDEGAIIYRKETTLFIVPPNAHSSKP